MFDVGDRIIGLELPDTFYKLAELLEQDQFELLLSKNRIKDMHRKQDISLVYLMNDAVESFLVFHNATITGQYKSEYEGGLLAVLDKKEEEYVLVVHQGDSVITLLFEDLLQQNNLYNYGDIGHFWVKGYEYLRQLEYQFAVIRDKYRFLGSSSCNEKELVFMRLADFPPVKKYRSVPKAYYVPYPDSIYPEAVSYLMEAARSVGDRNMERMLKIYQKKPDSLKCNIIASMFHKKSHGRFIDKIINDMRDAASSYDRRKFDKEEEIQNRKIHEKALKIMNNFKQKGYECFLYREEPFVYLKDTITYKEHVLVFKNHGLNRKCDIYTITNDGMFYK